MEPAAEEHFSTTNSSQPVLFADGAPSWWAGAETTVALPWLLGGVCTAGLASNLLFAGLLADELRRGQGSPAHALLLNLCAADLTLVLGCIPTRIAAYASKTWVLGGFACKTADWLLHACLVAKSLSWAAAGQARYRQAVSSGKRLCWSRGRLAGVVASLWAAALLLPLPQLLFTSLEGSPQQSGLLYCVFRAPPHAWRFLDVFSKLYPLTASLAPSGFTCSCCWRALRRGPDARKRKKTQQQRPRLAQAGQTSQRGTWALLGLSLLFHAMWLPAWVVWLWQMHIPPSGQSRRPPPAALVFLAEVLLFLNSSLGPGLFLATSGELREGLRAVWRVLNCRREEGGRPGETPQALRELSAAKEEEEGEPAAEKVLPDVEHFWKDRRNTTAGEESDPIPWEHQA